MNLSRLLDQQLVILDANILVYAWTRSSAQCQELLRRCAMGEVQGVVPLPALVEASHRMMMIEAKFLGLTETANPARYLAKHPAKAKKLKVHHALVLGLLEAGIRVEAADPTDLLGGFELQAEHGFLSNDALILAMAKRLHVTSIASADSAFEHVPGFTLYRPEDLEASAR